jgi:hypothetical protein
LIFAKKKKGGRGRDTSIPGITAGSREWEAGSGDFRVRGCILVDRFLLEK